MKAYGKSRRDCANRTKPGTSRPCPCCIPTAAHRDKKVFVKRARRENAVEIINSKEA